MKLVILDPQQILFARGIGLRRFQNGQRLGCRDTFGEPNARSHILGASGELAVCVALGVEWEATTHDQDDPNRGLFSSADHNYTVWEGQMSRTYGLEIRTRRGGNTVKVRRSDDPDRLIVSVLSKGTDAYLVEGFIPVPLARLEKYLRDPGNRGVPNYFYPVAELMPLDELLHLPV